ncbi:MAG: leucine-rich repeat domain-containing protein [Muribaculaceae bacterium]|nr:leucine-rich repeat domain-containing protein [Muribaculaceae bacterium]
MKTRLLAGIALMALAAGSQLAARRIPARVQGTDYAATLPADGRQKASDWEWDPNPDAPALPMNEFTFDDIENWTGTGENKAALVIQWNDPRETHAIVFGYRWDGLATGTDMIKAVVKNNPRLYTLMQYTNVSSPTDPLGGYTINGFGWDADNDGDIALVDTKDGEIYTSEDGFFEHPRGYVPGSGGSSDYDYDDWLALDEDDYWGAGWFLSYWSYWVGPLGETLLYSNWGASGRVLEDGACDGWNFSLNMYPSDWKEFKSAPSLIPEGAKTEFAVGDLFYKLIDFSKGTVKVVNPSVLTTIEKAAYRDFDNADIVIPSTFSEGEQTYTVIEIDDEAFADVAGIVSVTIPASVSKIGARAFLWNEGLVEIKGADGTDLDKTLTSIGEEAFKGCVSLRSLVLPEAMRVIPKGAYMYSPLADNLTVPSTVEEISDEAFAYTQIKDIYIPASVRKIGNKAFYGKLVSSVKSDSFYPAELDTEAFLDNIYSSATLTVPDGFTGTYAEAAGWKRFSRTDVMTVAVNTGDTFSLDGVTYNVTDTSEESPSLKVSYAKVDGKPDRTKIAAANKAAYTGAVTVPEKIRLMGRDYKVTAINDSAFYGASEMTSLSISAKVETIGAHTFYDCTKLAEVTLPSTVKELGTYAFSYSGIKSIILPEGTERLGDRVFFQCSALESVNIPESLTAIPSYCFSYCKSLESLVFGDNIKEFGTYAMQNCSSLTSVTLPESLKSISTGMFSSCASLETAAIPASVTEIGNTAFSGCSSLVLTLHEGITTIGTEAFKGIANTSFRLPETVTAVSNGLFNGCPNLTDLTIGTGVKSIGSSAFANCKMLENLTVSDSSEGDDSRERLSASGISFPASLTSIGNYAFQNCAAIRSVIIPETVTSLGTYVFQGSGITEAELPNSITTGPSSLFYSCANLKKVTLGNSMKSIGQNMFRDCTALETISVKDEEETPDTPAINLPATLTTIGTWAFTNCKNMTSIVIPDGVTSIGANDFDGCSALASVTLPARLTSIGNYAFRNTAITELTLPATTGDMAYTSDILYGCPEGTKVYVCNTGTPKKAGSNLWRIATGKYADIIVAAGKKSDYMAAAGWKSSVISEVMPDGIECEYTVDDNGSDDVEIRVEAGFTYETELPAMFREANDSCLFTDQAEFNVLYREATTTEDTPESIAEEGDDAGISGFTSTPLSLDTEGTGSFFMTRPGKTTAYDVMLSAATGETTVTGTPGTVTLTGKIETGMTVVTDGCDAETEIYTLDGVRVNGNSGLQPGIYVTVRHGKSDKIIVK